MRSALFELVKRRRKGVPHSFCEKALSLVMEREPVGEDEKRFDEKVI